MKKREERIKRFGVVESIKPQNVKYKEYGNRRARDRREKYDSEDDSDSSEDSELSQGDINMEKVNKIKPKKDKEGIFIIFLFLEYKIKLEENPEFIKKRVIFIITNISNKFLIIS